MLYILFSWGKIDGGVRNYLKYFQYFYRLKSQIKFNNVIYGLAYGESYGKNSSSHF
jgi:hypothetical protein